MRHSKFPKNNRHKKMKKVDAAHGDNEDSDQQTRQVNYNEKNKKKLIRQEERLLEQHVPRKLMELLEAKRKMQGQKSHKKRNKSHRELICVRPNDDLSLHERGMTRSSKPLPDKIEQGLYESEQHFLARLNRISAKAKAEANIEERFDVDFCDKLDDKSKDDSKMNERKRKRSDGSKNLNKKEKSGKGEEDLISRKIRRRRKVEMKKKEKEMKKRTITSNDDFYHLKDDVKFGDIVLAPPDLSRFKSKKKNK